MKLIAGQLISIVSASADVSVTGALVLLFLCVLTNIHCCPVLRGGGDEGVQVRVNCRCRFSGIITSFAETGTLSNLGNTNSARGAGQKVPGTSLLFPAVLELQVHAIMRGLLYMGSWRVKLQSLNSMRKHFSG